MGGEEVDIDARINNHAYYIFDTNYAAPFTPLA
jgi:hypothetical protein